MNFIKIMTVIVLLTGVSSSVYALPNITLLATGGTIAGGGDSAIQSRYTAGKIGIDELIHAVPEINNIAHLHGEQIAEIGSQNMDDHIWLKLAKRINNTCNTTDGFVITHGTDTLEETAYFLNLTVQCEKPVVMVGAMHPATALGADGPLNLYNAVVVASDPQSAKRGVLIAMNKMVLDSRDATKTSTTSVEAFQSPNMGALGHIHNGRVKYLHARVPKQPLFDISKLHVLPKVGIIYNYANASDLPVKALIADGYQGIVSAGMGNGNLYHTIFDTLAAAAKKGVAVVRSSRVPTGATTKDTEVDDAKYGFVASGLLNPQKARVLLKLALTQTQDPQEIQKIFFSY